jgi:hypothetical protein
VTIVTRPIWRLRWAHWLSLKALRALAIAGVLTAIHLAMALHRHDFASRRLYQATPVRGMTWNREIQHRKGARR